MKVITLLFFTALIFLHNITIAQISSDDSPFSFTATEEIKPIDEKQNHHIFNPLVHNYPLHRMRT